MENVKWKDTQAPAWCCETVGTVFLEVDISQTTDDVPLQHHEMHTCDTSKLQKPVFLLFFKNMFSYFDKSIYYS